ncbi:LTA synthase family protein [Rhizosphaericola mali]|uniref:Sulfatase-like hydrolase/transferase n=1 Tax=Rhizosphaericola mali TaxID=2545455 RepID=A0A5P2FYH1_9BACT|nr:alkaline phosphatase family protein [Rhizosphaericola mali]QES87428.1 sulfatase-like hydrolase/transferase [Rhizosphaericola mali]
MNIFYKKPQNRFALIWNFMFLMLFLSFIVRLLLMFYCWKKADLNVIEIFQVFLKGLFFDIGTASLFAIPGIIYFLLFPVKYIGSKVDKILVYTGVFLSLFILSFSFFAEFTFWDEFQSRFNFIAVDYLIYTYEVVNNINESYPLPLLIASMILMTLTMMWLLGKMKAFKITFAARPIFINKLIPFALISGIAILFMAFVPNRWAETVSNRYEQELTKNGIYSFFAAYRQNELSYDNFYISADEKKSLGLVRQSMQRKNVQFVNNEDITRFVKDSGTELHPNVIMITIESFSASFMQHFGNDKAITPFLDSLADRSVLFTNLYATGTRTVRGMEALTLAIPPTPGNSIVRRTDNGGLYTVGSVFQSKNYSRTFFYGGDGYFDNMNDYFSGNGFDIVDRGRTDLPGDELPTKRTMIPDELVHFKNAWGIDDEDLFDAVIQQADVQSKQWKPFYNFIMTTSNHKPYTYPTGKIDIPSGSGRDGAVKYTDYAIRKFIGKASQKSWFKNTVFVIVADHCASSAGKDAIDISKYHIPCMIYNLPDFNNMKINKLCSQIDIYPTLFHLLHWSYTSKFFGEDVLDNAFVPRALPGSYQELGYVVGQKMGILSPVKNFETYSISTDFEKEKKDAKADNNILPMNIAYYQTAYDLYKKGALKQ